MNLARLYRQVADRTGWSYREIDDMQVDRFCSYCSPGDGDSRKGEGIPLPQMRRILVEQGIIKE